KRDQVQDKEEHEKNDGNADPRRSALAEQPESRRNPRPALTSLDGTAAFDEFPPFGRSCDIGNLGTRGLVRIALAHGALPEKPDAPALLKNPSLPPLAAVNRGTCPSGVWLRPRRARRSWRADRLSRDGLPLPGPRSSAAPPRSPPPPAATPVRARGR